MDHRLVGEFMGTLVLIFLGDGVNANVLLAKSAAENSGWIVITTGWALAVMAGVFAAIACGSPDAHINPAVTLAFAIVSGDYSKLIPYAIAQVIGAVAGATLVWLHYLPHWAHTPDTLRKRACFCTTPSIRNTGANLLSEILGTFVLVVIVAAIFSKALSASGPAPGLGPFLVGAVVWAIGLCLGGTTCFPINPARDLGPRIAHWILPIAGKGDSDWKYAAVPIAGALLGAALGGAFIKMAFQS
jgi:glycerol uptake facilitator protein